MRRRARWLVLVVLACAACDSGAPRAPATEPAQATMSEQDRRAAALERVRTNLASTKRKHTPLEAPVELTNAYVDLEFAYGFARLGKTARARELVVGAKASLGAAVTDAVHAMLIALYEARIAQAIAGRATPAQLPLELETKLAAADRVVRYKVDRLRGVSTVLESARHVDAIDEWIKKGDQRGPELGATTGLADEARTHVIAEVVDRVSVLPDPKRAQLVGDSLDALAMLPPALATPVLERAIEVAGSLPAQPRALVAARALSAAAQLGDRKVVSALLPELGAITGPEAAASIEAAVRGLRILDMRAELATLLAALEPSTRDDPAAYLALAGGWFAAGKIDRATRVIDAVVPAFAAAMVLPKRLELSKALGFAFANTTIERAEPGLAVVIAQYPDITDSYGTNSHFCLSAVALVDSLVIGLTGQ